MTSKKTIIAFPIIILLLGATVIGITMLRGDIHYYGEPLSYWIELFRSEDSSDQMSGYLALTNIGGPAAPDIIQLFADYDESDENTERIMKLLTKIGKPAVPALGLALLNRNERVRLGVLMVLARLGPNNTRSVQSAVLHMLGDPNEWIRIRAVEVLGGYSNS